MDRRVLGTRYLKAFRHIVPVGPITDALSVLALGRKDADSDRCHILECMEPDPCLV